MSPSSCRNNSRGLVISGMAILSSEVGGQYPSESGDKRLRLIAVGIGTTMRTGAPVDSGEEKMMVDLVLAVNGVERRLEVDTRTSLLDVLREQIGLTGSKK